MYLQENMFKVSLWQTVTTRWQSSDDGLGYFLHEA
jgi:hypothetical protein